MSSRTSVGERLGSARRACSTRIGGDVIRGSAGRAMGVVPVGSSTWARRMAVISEGVRRSLISREMVE